MSRHNKKRLPYRKIANLKQAVLNYYCISADDLLGQSRKMNLVQARQILIYILRTKTGISFPAISKVMGYKDHTTPLYAYEKIKTNYDRYSKAIDEIVLLSSSLHKSSKQVSPKEHNAGNQKNQTSNLIKSRKDLPRMLSLDKFDSERMNIFFKLWKDGNTLQNIAKRHSITRERVRQIVDQAILHQIIELVESGVVVNKEIFYQNLKNEHNIARKRKMGIPIHKPVKEVKPKRWARSYDRCRECSKTIYPHQSYGYCTRCFPKSEIFKEAQKSSFQRHREKRREQQRGYQKKYYYRPDVVKKRRKMWDQRNFGGNREKAIAKAGNKCQLCGISREKSLSLYNRDLFVIHLNGEDNNELRNLFVSCKKCHPKVIQSLRKKISNNV